MASPKDLFDEAERLEEAGEKERSLALWRQLAAEHPDPGVYCRLARAARELNLLEEAWLAFATALDCDPRLGVAYLGLAEIAMENEDYERAEAELNKLVQFETSAPAYSMLATCLMRIGKPSEAVEACERALQIEADYEEAQCTLGMLLKQEDPVRAEFLFRAALELDPEYARAHRELGFLLLNVDPTPDAEYHIRRSLELDPGSAWAHIYFGNLLWRRGDLIAAKSEFERAIEAEPESSFPLWSLANLLEHQGDREAARMYYEKAVVLGPDDTVAAMNLGRFLIRGGDVSRGRHYIERALEKDPNYESARRILEELDRESP